MQSCAPIAGAGHNFPIFEGGLLTPFVVPEGSTATIAVLLRGALGCSHREAKELVLAGRALVNGVATFDVAARPRGGAEISLAAAGAPRLPR